MRSIGKSKAFFIVQAVLIFAGFSQLLRTDGYYVPYLLVAIFGILSLFGNGTVSSEERPIPSKKPFTWVTAIFSFLFACMVTFANHMLWNFKTIEGMLNFAAFFFGTYFAFWNILSWIQHHLRKITWKESKSWRPLTVFFVTFGIIAAIDLLVLFLCTYPANFTVDSLVQMNQIFSGNYTNHHPFYHTMVIKLFVSIGLRLFHDINAAVACYSVFSILFMAATFSFAVAMAAELRAPKWMIVLLQLYFALMPYHIMYSMTMWKDIFHGAFVLLYVLLFFRCMTGMRLKRFNYIGLTISALGVCLFRSNGFFAFVLTTLCFLLLWRLRKKGVLLIMVAVVAGSYVLKHPFLSAIGVSQTDLIESLSIPAQQIARVVDEEYELTEEERELLSQVVDVDRIPGTYVYFGSDPIKNLVREKGNQEYIRTHAGDFIRLYVSLGMKYPSPYLRGWIEQTKGYWNGGYHYWVWWNDVEANSWGVERTVHSDTANTILTWYLNQFMEQPVLQIFMCIGFSGWLLLIAFCTAVYRNDRIGMMLTVLNIMIVLSLLVATPVFSEFRYNYSLFCALPLIIVLVLRPDSLLGFQKKENI